MADAGDVGGAGGGALAAYTRWLQVGGEKQINMAQMMVQMYLSVSFDPANMEHLLKHEIFQTTTSVLQYGNARLLQAHPAPAPPPPAAADPADPLGALGQLGQLGQLGDAAPAAAPAPPPRPPDAASMAIDVLQLVQRLAEMAVRQLLGSGPPYKFTLPRVRLLVLCIEAFKGLLMLRANRHLFPALIAGLAALRRGPRGVRSGIRVPTVGGTGALARPSGPASIIADITHLLRPFIYALCLCVDADRSPWRPWLCALGLDLAILFATVRQSRVDQRDPIRRARLRRSQALQRSQELAASQGGLPPPASLRLSDEAGEKIAARWRPLVYYILRDPMYDYLLRGRLERFIAFFNRIPLLGVIIGFQLQLWAMQQPLHYAVN